jgi:hypothetical protein
MITNPSFDNEEAVQCVNWLYKLLSTGVRVVTSDLCDYEIRRGLILAQKTSSGGNGLRLLDEYRQLFEFLPVTANVLAEAASLWALARFTGNPNAPEKNIDIDIILCGQWNVLKRQQPGRHIIIAITFRTSRLTLRLTNGKTSTSKTSELAVSLSIAEA